LRSVFRIGGPNLFGRFPFPVRQKAPEKTEASFPVAFNPGSQKGFADLSYAATLG